MNGKRNDCDFSSSTAAHQQQRGNVHASLARFGPAASLNLDANTITNKRPLQYPSSIRSVQRDLRSDRVAPRLQQGVPSAANLTSSSISTTTTTANLAAINTNDINEQSSSSSSSSQLLKRQASVARCSRSPSARRSPSTLSCRSTRSSTSYVAAHVPVVERVRR